NRIPNRAPRIYPSSLPKLHGQKPARLSAPFFSKRQCRQRNRECLMRPVHCGRCIIASLVDPSLHVIRVKRVKPAHCGLQQPLSAGLCCRNPSCLHHQAEVLVRIRGKDIEGRSHQRVVSLVFTMFTSQNCLEVEGVTGRRRDQEIWTSTRPVRRRWVWLEFEVLVLQCAK